MDTAANGRVVFLDWLRVIACFMVILVHSTEPFYLGGEGVYIASPSDYMLCTFINSSVRCCVPLFVLASSYLLFPLKVPAGEFFKRRAGRILIPLLVWIVVYSFFGAWQSASADASDGVSFVSALCVNLLRCIFNFPDPAGHLWFVYMLIGVYALMPLITPWAQKASRRELQIMLAVWAATTFIPFIRQASVALTGTPELWGEANWNEFNAFYYVSGYIGYLLMGYYIRREVPDLNWRQTLRFCIPAFIVGYAITALWYGTSLWMTFPGHDGVQAFPVNEPIDLAVNIETSWRFCTPGVALMTAALFLLIRKISSDGAFYRRIVLPVSKASYGAYLMHIVFLTLIHGWLRPLFIGLFSASALSGVAADVMASLCCIFTTAFLTYAVSCAVAVLLQKIPVVGKYIVG